MTTKIADTWQHMLNQMFDDYDLYQHISKNGFPVDVKLAPVKDFWVLSIVEDYSILGGEIYYTASTEKLDNAKKWTYEHLKNWPRVKDTADGRWVFLDRTAAEKFTTLFRLRWQE